MELEILDWIRRVVANHYIFFIAIFLFTFGIVVTNARFSRYFKVFLVTLLVTGVVAYVPAKKLVNWIYSEPRTLLLQLKAEQEDDEIKLWEFTPRLWEKVEVVEGSLNTAKIKDGDLYICRSFDPVTLEARGTWRGSVSDLELIRNREKIREIRNELENLAKQGIRTRIQVTSIVRRAVNQIIAKIASSIEEETLHKGEEIKKSINKEVKEIDLERNVKEEGAEETNQGPWNQELGNRDPRGGSGG